MLGLWLGCVSLALDGYLMQTLPAPKAYFLLHTWTRAALDVRANGFQPEMEAIGERGLQMKKMAEGLPRLSAEANILGACERGSMKFDALAEPHASVAERLSKTQLYAALSAGKGSALAFVSRWSDHVSIDACVVNPSYLIAGEGAERALIRHVVQEALDDGIRSIQLRPTGFQLDGDTFYAPCGFYPGEDIEGGLLVYRA